MIDKGLYRKNFRGGGADMGAGASGMGSGNAAPGPGDTGGGGGYEQGFTDQRGNVGSSPTSTGGGDNQFAAPGTLSDPRERLDFFGPTRFGPARKFTGSFLDNIFSGGYRPVTPTGNFQSRFSQMGGLGKGVLGGLISLINPVAGLAYKGISSLGALKDYDNLADYAKGEFGLFQDEDEEEVDTIDIRDKYNRLGITPTVIPNGIASIDLGMLPMQRDLVKTGRLQEFQNVPSVSPQEYDFFSNAMAELTPKQKAFINSKKFGLQENMISPQQVFDEITNPNLGIYDTGTFGFGAQEPTTEEEYNDYLRSLGLTQKI